MNRRALRWAIPLAALPVLLLLGYGFRTDPREIPSPSHRKAGGPVHAQDVRRGADLTLDALRGQVVVVNFWASWCYPACYEEAPMLARAWATYKGSRT